MRKLMIAGLLALAAFSGWQALSPWIAMAGLRDAAREADRDALEQAIDFPALRVSAKAELIAQIRARGDDTGLGIVGAGLAERLVEGTVDAVVTPRGMAALLRTGSLIPGRETAAKEIDWKVRWMTWDTFRAFPEREDGGRHPSLIFRRDGLSWKLVGIDIPDGDGRPG